MTSRHRASENHEGGLIADLPDLHREHRLDFERFVLDEAAPWHRQHLSRLYQAWHDYNATYFAHAMTPPYLLLAEPITPKIYGDTSAATGFGAQMQIRIRSSLVRGTHPHMQHGTQDAKGIERYVLDVLLHETIHQYQFEVLGVSDESYDGHGPVFRDNANRIGTALGLPPVRVSKVRAAQRTVPSCAQWPHCVRPVDYYRGAVEHTPQAVRSAEDILLTKLERLTRDVDIETVERVCRCLLTRKKQFTEEG
jgi:hypothetical protein